MTATTLDANEEWVGRALLLAWVTIVYNVIEGAVAITFGVSDDSVALFGFGADSLIEVASASIVMWRFRGEAGRGPTINAQRERRATMAIGALFVVLAVVMATSSVAQLVAQAHPETTLPGLVISALSLSLMLFLWRAKLKAGRALASPTVLGDAGCTLACFKLSAVLFAGSLIFLIAPSLWWVDSVAAIVLGVLIAREGAETIQEARKPEFSGGCGCHGAEA